MTDDGYVLVLVPLPDSVPAAVRVRRLLKAALRGYRLKCVLIRDPKAEELAATAAAGSLRAGEDDG
jgi:hypothetical protein